MLALDVDDMPFLGLMYPGFDVYLADLAGLVPHDEPLGYTELIDHEIHGPRMRQHAARCFAGDACVEFPFESTAAYARPRSRPGKDRKGRKDQPSAGRRTR